MDELREGHILDNVGPRWEKIGSNTRLAGEQYSLRQCVVCAGLNMASLTSFKYWSEEKPRRYIAQPLAPTSLLSVITGYSSSVTTKFGLNGSEDVWQGNPEPKTAEQFEVKRPHLASPCVSFSCSGCWLFLPPVQLLSRGCLPQCTTPAALLPLWLAETVRDELDQPITARLVERRRGAFELWCIWCVINTGLRIITACNNFLKTKIHETTDATPKRWYSSFFLTHTNNKTQKGKCTVYVKLIWIVRKNCIHSWSLYILLTSSL